MLVHLLIFFEIVIIALCNKVCFEDLGCFTTEYPFGSSTQRPISVLPEDPSVIKTKFYLYNKNIDGILISFNNVSDEYIQSIPTKFYVHGFYDTPNNQLKNVLIKNVDCNVITVDWRDGSKLPYTQATANTRVVGAQLAQLIQSIIKKTGASAKDLHLIGHSLGAHVCGYAAKRIEGIGRISGLDPAGPYFEYTPTDVRLDKTDAEFVDIMHTNAKKIVSGTPSIGLFSPIGDVDFYPNGGEIQPGCWLTDNNFDPACSHKASIKLYIDSIEGKCLYTAYQCNSTGEYYKGNCLQCSVKGCNRMGYWASSDKDLDSQYLNTQSVFSHDKCKQNYQVTLISGQKGSKKANGKFSIYLKTKSETSSTVVIDNGNIVFKANSINKKLISLNKPIKNDKILSAFITYERGWNVISYESRWVFDSIEIYSADAQMLVTLCPPDLDFGSMKTVEYTEC